MRSICVLLLLIGVGALDAEQLKESDAAWNQMTARLERAALDGATKDLRAIRSELQGRIATAGADEAMVRYTLAYASYRMVNLPDVPEKDRTDLLNDAVAQLQQVIKRNSKDAEAHALLGSVYGLQIAHSPFIRGMTLGPRANSAIDRADEFGIGTARGLLRQADVASHTPTRKS